MIADDVSRRNGAGYAFRLGEIAHYHWVIVPMALHERGRPLRAPSCGPQRTWPFNGVDGGKPIGGLADHCESGLPLDQLTQILAEDRVVVAMKMVIGPVMMRAP